MIEYKANLLEGKIGRNLFKLSIPVVISSLVFFIYGLTDIKFISYYVGDAGVNSVSAVAMFGGLGMAITSIPSVGSQVLISQMIGLKNEKLTRRYAVAGIQMSLVLGVIFGFLCFLLAPNLMNILGLSKNIYLTTSIEYLKLNSIGFLFFFLVSTLSAIVTADGDSLGPLIFVLIGIILNIILDYVFLGIFHFGVIGTVIASNISIAVGLLLFLIYFNRKKSRFRYLNILSINKLHIYRNIFKIGFPVSVSQILFSLISIQIGTVITRIDQSVLGVQRIGIQFESLSWGVTGGVASAMSTFVGQNYGAGNYKRIKVGIIKTAITIFIIGIFITILFITMGGKMYSIFLKEPKLIKLGISYITIIGYSEAFQSLDILITGCFNGIGQTRVPLYVGSFAKLMRIPFVYLVAPFYGLNGVWWVISLNTIIYGVVITLVFIYYFKRIDKTKIQIKGDLII